MTKETTTLYLSDAMVKRLSLIPRLRIISNYNHLTNTREKNSKMIELLLDTHDGNSNFELVNTILSRVVKTSLVPSYTKTNFSVSEFTKDRITRIKQELNIPFLHHVKVRKQLTGQNRKITDEKLVSFLIILYRSMNS